MTINRIAIRYQDRIGIAFDTDALGVYDYEVSTQGRSFRPPRDRGQDLFAVRSWLRGEGFHLHHTDCRSGHGTIIPARFTEHWYLNPPEPEPDPVTGFSTGIRHNLDSGVWAVYDLADPDTVLATTTTEAEAKWNQIRLHDKDLWHLASTLADTHPVLKPRILLDACQIVVAGGVQAVEGLTYMVQDDVFAGRTHRVQLDPDPLKWSCLVYSDKDPNQAGNLCLLLSGNGSAPVLPHGRKRCHHETAAWLHRELCRRRAAAERNGPATKKAPAEVTAGAAVDSTPDLPEPASATHHSYDTTGPVPLQSRRIAASYADGRPARYSDGTVVRYTAGGKPVDIPPSSW